MKTVLCGHCDQPFQPSRPGQRYCSMSCSSSATAARKAALSAGRVQRIAEAAPNCEVCGTKVTPWHHESLVALRKRRFCSHECRLKRVTEQPTKLCQGCGKSFAKKPQTAYRDWEEQRYCCKQCRPQPSKSTRHKLAQHAKGRRFNFAAPSPPDAGTQFQSVEEWLQHNKPTACPVRYAAPVIGAGK